MRQKAFPASSEPSNRLGPTREHPPGARLSCVSGGRFPAISKLHPDVAALDLVKQIFPNPMQIVDAVVRCELEEFFAAEVREPCPAYSSVGHLANLPNWIGTRYRSPYSDETPACISAPVTAAFTADERLTYLRRLTAFLGGSYRSWSGHDDHVRMLGAGPQSHAPLPVRRPSADP